jgi:hypothetical protein
MPEHHEHLRPPPGADLDLAIIDANTRAQLHSLCLEPGYLGNPLQS